MDGFDRQLLDRLPLAEAVFLALSHCWQGTFLADLFDHHAPRCYTDRIEFPTLVELIRDALLRHRGSANKAFVLAIRQGRLDAAVSSAYQKLGRLPLPLSRAFLRECTLRLRQLMPAGGGGVPLPACLEDLEVVAFDGKTIKHVTRRLKPLRHLRGRMLGGKLLVALCLRDGLALAMSCDADAFRNDAALADALLEQLPLAPGGRPTLFVADRQFCDLRLMDVIAGRGDHFLIRHNRATDFVPDPAHPAREGVDARGRRWVEQRGVLGAAGNKRRRVVRRITLYRPGEDEVIVLTDLLDPAAYPAPQLLEAYLARWGIEQVFQDVTEVFNLKHLIGTTPKATIFQAAFCFVLYNVAQLIKSHTARAAARPVREVSTRKLFDDVCEQMNGWAVAATSARATRRALGEWPDPATLRQRIALLLSMVWTDWWIKSPTRPRPASARPTRYAKSGRASVHRVLQEYQRLKTHRGKRPKRETSRCRSA